MNEQKMLEEQVRAWEAAGLWIDDGRWVRGKNGTPIYLPTKKEITRKCRLFRSSPGWQGASKRAPRGGEYGVATTAGLK